MELSQFLIVALLLLIGQGFATWYFAYFKKKGEYEAIKEDIEHVTRTTEGIKKELDLIADNEISFRSERRNAVIGYLESLERVLTYIGFQMKVHKDNVLRKYIKNILPSHSVITSKLHLLVESSETTKLVTEIEVNIVEMLTSAQSIARAFAEAIDGGHESDAARKLVAVEEQQTKRMEDLQSQIFKQRNELIVKFREILKQDYSER